MKRFLVLMLSALIILGCCPIIGASAAETTTIIIGDEMFTFNVGDTAVYTIELKTVNPIVNGQFVVDYPQDLLTVNEPHFPVVGDSTMMCNYKTNSENKISFNFSNRNKVDFTSGGVLAQITFEVDDSGTGEIVFNTNTMSYMTDKHELISELPNAVFTETLSGSSYVEPTVPTEPSTDSTEESTDASTEPETTATGIPVETEEITIDVDETTAANEPSEETQETSDVTEATEPASEAESTAPNSEASTATEPDSVTENTAPATLPIESTEPSSETQATSATESTDPSSETQATSATESTEPSSETQATSATESTEPSSETQATSATESTDPSSETQATSATESTEPSSETQATSATEATEPTAPKPVNASSFKVSGVKDYTYNGKAQTPKITVTSPDGAKLKSGVDYKIATEESLDAGTYKITINYIGKYCGAKTVKYKILKADNTAKISYASKTVKYSKLKKAKQTIKPITVKSAKGAVVYKKLSGSSAFKLNSSGSITVKKGTKKGNYTLKVKVTVKGNANYKSTYKTLKFKITVK